MNVNVMQSSPALAARLAKAIFVIQEATEVTASSVQLALFRLGLKRKLHHFKNAIRTIVIGKTVKLKL